MGISIDATAESHSRLAERIITRHRERIQAAQALVSDPSGYTPSQNPPTPAPARAKATLEAIQQAPEAQPEQEKVIRAAIKTDFKVFLALIWKHLGLPAPTPIQLSMADYLQYGPRSAVIMAFRGAAKSWITAAYALWVLYCNPQKKVMVVSGSAKRSIAFTTFCLALIRDMPLLQHLEPTRNQRQSATLFDVGPARPDQSASLFAAGITGQIVGFRADLIVGDDVETNTNSMTVMMREKLADAIREFDAILKPGGQIRFLGTPQTNDSIYNKLPARGYSVRIWPMVYPNKEEMERYGLTLSPYIRNRVTPENTHKSTEPTRFGPEEITRLRLSWGSGGWQLQFMLDTSLSDASRYPLKLRNLIVMSLEDGKGPEEVTWGPTDDLALNVPVIGAFKGDKLHAPLAVGPRHSPWQIVKAMIDTSDQGEDETAIAIGGLLNARVGLLAVKGWVDGAAPSTILKIAKLLVRFRVNEVTIETNFGGTMFGQLLKPVLINEWAIANKGKPAELHGGTTILEEKAARVQKELRIISDLEPATQAHRVILSHDVVTEDYAEIMAKDDGDTKERYSTFYQYCNLTRERDSLTHDDRIEVIGGLVGLFREQLGVNPLALARQRETEFEEDAYLKELDALDDAAGYPKVKGNGRSPRHASQHSRRFARA